MKEIIKGFTLIETMVAISILVTTIVAPLTMAANSLFQSRYSRDQVTATYLAQEAVEMIKYVRDRNLMANLSNGNVDWLDGLWTAGINNKWVELDWETIQNTPIYYLCGGVGNNPQTCRYLSYDGSYKLDSTAPLSKFKRAVKITKTNNLDEIRVEARVYWQTGGANMKSVKVVGYMYNWTQLNN